MKAATQPCPKSTTGKHAWKWLKNGTTSTVRSNAMGTTAHIKLVGIYTCQCGARRNGRSNPNGDDLRAFV